MLAVLTTQEWKKRTFNGESELQRNDYSSPLGWFCIMLLLYLHEIDLFILCVNASYCILQEKIPAQTAGFAAFMNYKSTKWRSKTAVIASVCALTA